MDNETVTVKRSLYSSAELNPVVVSVQPTLLSVAGNEILHIHGRKFASHVQGKFPVVTINNQTCELIAQHNDTYIKCRTLEINPGRHPVQVFVPGAGVSIDSTYVVIDLTVTSISPNRGSLLGGTKLTIHGSGFSTKNSSDLAVSIGDRSCHVTDSTNNRITCVTSSTEKVVYISNGGVSEGANAMNSIPSTEKC